MKGGEIVHNPLVFTALLVDMGRTFYKHLLLHLVQRCLSQQDSANEEALSDETKQSLTSVLSMLGVIHDNVKHKGDAHGIFVLGLDAEDLREVVSVIHSQHCCVSGGTD